MHEILCADSTDCKGQMIVTVTISNNLLHKFEDKIMVGTIVAITRFQVAPKIDFDHVDSDCILLLKELSTIKTIPPLLKEYKFIPITTIK